MNKYCEPLKKHDLIIYKKKHSLGSFEGKITYLSKDGKQVGVEESDYYTITSYTINREDIISVKRWIPVEELGE